MCECLEYDDGSMYLCECCGGIYRERLKEWEGEAAARLDAAKRLRDWIVDHSFVPPMILAMDDFSLARIVAPKEGE